MPALLALRLITYLLVCAGVAALALAGLLGPVGGAVLGLALFGSWVIDQVRERMPVRPLFAWALVVAAAAAIALDLLYLAQSILDGMVHLLLFLILLRLFRRRSLKDLRDAGFLSFFMLVAASAVTFNVSFLFVFVVIPRVGQATLPFRAELGRRSSCFSERVELGSYGEIEADQTVVMRVRFPDSIPEPFRLPNLRWRGLAFDRFDGRVWESGARQRTLLRREASGDFALATPRGTGPIVRQEILLDPIGSDAVFAAPKALRIETSAGAVGLDDMGSIVLPTVSTRLQYSVDSELEQTPPRGLRAGAWPVEGLPRGPVRFLELPPLPERIRTLARDVAAGSHSPYEAALRLSQYLSSDRFRYTLVLKQQTALDPLEEFLFVRRSGNCEYFAASLAVMLRSVGIPARAAAEEVLGGPSTWMLYVDAVRMRWYRYVVNWSLRDQVSVAVSMHRGALEWRGG